MKVLATPGLDFFLAEVEDVEVYPFRGTFDEMRNKTIVILHTSGSTGIPKPVYVAHGTFCCNDAQQMIPALGGRPTTIHHIRDKRLFLAFPLFHAANLTFTIGYNVFCGVVPVLPPAAPLTDEIVNDMHTFGNLDGSLIPPSMVVDLFKNSEYLVNMVRRLKFLMYVGGTLPKEVGNFLSTRLRLMTLLGATETMMLPIEVNNVPEDWEYIPISPCLGAEFRLSRDGLRELVIVRNERYDLFQGCFSTFPNLNEYGMKDLYERHPTREGAWLFKARADDIIAFTNAEKLNPVTMESVIMAHPEVKGAVIGGHGEFQASLLIEPKTNPFTKEEEEKLLEDVWPAVVKANLDCPAHGRIMKNFVMFTKPDKPLPRAGKETVQRYAALKEYGDEFKALYAPPVPITNSVPEAIKELDNTEPTPDDLQAALFRVISSNSYLTDLTYVADLFECGLDSLQVPVLITHINTFLTESRKDDCLICNKTLYDNPSIEKLAAFLSKSLTLSESPTRNGTPELNGVSTMEVASKVGANPVPTQVDVPEEGPKADIPLMTAQAAKCEESPVMGATPVTNGKAKRNGARRLKAIRSVSSWLSKVFRDRSIRAQ